MVCLWRPLAPSKIEVWSLLVWLWFEDFSLVPLWFHRPNVRFRRHHRFILAEGSLCKIQQLHPIETYSSSPISSQFSSLHLQPFASYLFTLVNISSDLPSDQTKIPFFVCCSSSVESSSSSSSTSSDSYSVSIMMSDKVGK